MRVLPHSRFVFKTDAITEATTNLINLKSSVLVSKLRAFEVANEISQEKEPKKDKRITFSSVVKDHFYPDSYDWSLMMLT